MAWCHPYTHRHTTRWSQHRYVHLKLKGRWDYRDYRISIQIYRAWRQIREKTALCYRAYLTIRVDQRFNQSQHIYPKVTTQKTSNPRVPGREKWTSARHALESCQQWSKVQGVISYRESMEAALRIQVLRDECSLKILSAGQQPKEMIC